MQTLQLLSLDRAEFIAQRIAEGLSEEVLKEQYEITAEDIKQLNSSPIFQYRVFALKHQLQEADPNMLGESIKKLGPEIVAKGRQLLHCGDEKVEASMVKSFLDRVAPRVTKNENVNTAKVVIEAGAMEGMFKTIIIASGVDPKKLASMDHVSVLKVLKEALPGE